MQKILLMILAVIILSFILIVILPYTRKNATVTILDKKFNVEVAETESAREKGLMDRKSLDTDAGMLFVFPTSDTYTFWMKNTLIPLDIIWLNDNKIVEMTTLNPASGSNIPQYTPKEKANYVLELNAGMIQKYNFKPGDPVKIEY